MDGTREEDIEEAIRWLRSRGATVAFRGDLGSATVCVEVLAPESSWMTLRGLSRDIVSATKIAKTEYERALSRLVAMRVAKKTQFGPCLKFDLCLSAATVVEDGHPFCGMHANEHRQRAKAVREVCGDRASISASGRIEQSA